MDLDYNETQILLRDTMREYLGNEVPFDRIRKHEKSGEADAELWAELCKLGWMGTPLPAALGGGDGSIVDAGLIVEELERRAAVVPVVEVLAATLTVQRYAGAGELVSRVLSGEVVLVPALLEADDSYGSIAAEVDAGGRLRGAKHFVDYAAFATHHLVSARAEGGELGLYLVDAGASTVETRELRHVGRTPQSIVTYEGAAAERLCGSEAVGFLLMLGRTLCAVQAVSCMQMAVELSVAYTSVREQFGRPIGTFQAVHHHAANMATQLESSRFLAYEALDSLERGEASQEQIALAKAAASRAVPGVTMMCQQLHGGNGFIEENDVYFFTLRGKNRSLAWGTADECLELVAGSVERVKSWL